MKRKPPRKIDWGPVSGASRGIWLFLCGFILSGQSIEGDTFGVLVVSAASLVWLFLLYKEYPRRGQERAELVRKLASQVARHAQRSRFLDGDADLLIEANKEAGWKPDNLATEDWLKSRR
jgi:hypothetical protein